MVFSVPGALAPVHRPARYADTDKVKARKPKLASGERLNVDRAGLGAPEHGAQSGIIRTGTNAEALPKRAVRSTLTFLALGIIMLFLTYVVLATTVFVALRSDNHTVGVLRNTFPVGQAPADAIVYVSNEPVGTTVLARAEQAILGVSAGSVVQIVVGPAGTIKTNKDGYVTLNGHPTPYEVEVDERTLVREYLAMCLSGACEPGQPVRVSQANIVGEVKGYLGLGTMTEPDGMR